MLVLPSGDILGTVGGGCGEAEVWQAAMQVLETGMPSRLEVDLTEDENSDSGKVCGGRFEVYIDYWHAQSEALEALRQATQSQSQGLLVTYLGPVQERVWRRSRPEPRPDHPPLIDPCGKSLFLSDADAIFWPQAFPEGDPRIFTHQAHQYFLDPIVPGHQLVIAGAGHIARPLASMAHSCGYRVTVVDDRPEYACREYFPAAQVVCQDFGQFFSALPGHPRTSVVLVTRGHKFDEACLRGLVEKQVAYIGMIGSRRRTRAVVDDLLNEGVSPQWLSQLYAPVGLDIGALTPEEIAISILAEMILLRRGGKGGSLRLLREV